MSSKRVSLDPEFIPICKRRCITAPSANSSGINNKESNEERSGTTNDEFNKEHTHNVDILGCDMVLNETSKTKSHVPIFNDDVSMTVEEEEAEEEEEEEGNDEEGEYNEEGQRVPMGDDGGNAMSDISAGSSAVIEWVKTLIDAESPVEKNSAKTYSTVAVQTGETCNEADGDKLLIPSDRSYTDLKDDIEFAQRAAKQGWSKYWQLELQCLQLKKSARYYKVEREVFMRDLERLEEDRQQAVENAKALKKRFAYIGERMVAYSKRVD
ncbi:hypothetical protein K435DRAFT_872531 [Dendrothele bispora CBS 962.96]|uniref:Uncharacterized protein n=1 Tax=Dendrothele bispora (strain CBS 962.96) TaxID=1314807 RepID=A0A4S8L1L3_DENBC|nr:hypothetical protein K435DRAFT_872531 [Dendrothele bispora CBS 962.96]